MKQTVKIAEFLFKHKLVRYLFSGGLAAVTNLGILFLLTHFAGINYLVSGIISFIISVVVSFVLQKKWTFEDATTHETHKKFAVFVIIALINLAANTALLYLFTSIFGIYYLISQIIAAIIVAIWSYFLYKIFIFKAPVQTNEPVDIYINK